MDSCLTDSGVYDFGGFDIGCVAGYFKKYLREFPDSLIPIQWYDHFIEASRKYTVHDILRKVDNFSKE